MTTNMLFFDYQEHEKSFFEKNNIEGFNITFFEENLTLDTIKKLPQETLDNATVISVSTYSSVDKNIIENFKNLRIIATRSKQHEHICKKSTNERNIAILNVENCDDNNPQNNTHKNLQTMFDEIRDTQKGAHIYGTI
ncbi:hypothetical protein IKU74_03510 [bacterium]|nr:hypothetical protein [bacterium]